MTKQGVIILGKVAQMSFFDGRVSVPAATLTGPRVYSTDLHASHFDPSRTDDFVVTTARALKTKMLTKGTVTVHMSHLLSPGGVVFLQAFPEVLECNALLPAFREDKKSVEDYVQDHSEAYHNFGIAESKVAETVSLLERSFKRVMPWQLGNIHAEYRDRIVAGLVTPDSLVRNRLLIASGQNDRLVEEIASRIACGDFSEDGSMRRFLSGTDPILRKILGYYEQAVYHMVGTSVVNCESGTDLSPASSFNAFSVAVNDDQPLLTPISETSVFLRFFLGEAFEVMQSEATPVTVLDAMRFENVDRINQRLRDSKFHESYDFVVAKAIEKMNANHGEALESLDAEGFARMAVDIHDQFVCEIEKEVREYRSKAFEEAKSDAIGQTQKIGLSIAGIATGLGSLVTMYRFGRGYSSFLKSAKKAGALATPEGFQALAPEKKKEQLAAVIEKASLSAISKTKLLDAAKLLCDFNEAKVARL